MLFHRNAYSNRLRDQTYGSETWNEKSMGLLLHD